MLMESNDIENLTEPRTARQIYDALGIARNIIGAWRDAMLIPWSKVLSDDGDRVTYYYDLNACRARRDAMAKGVA